MSYRKLWPTKMSCRSEDGSILVETAFVLPVLIALVAVGLEAGYFMLANQKLDTLASRVSNMVSSAEQGITESEINDVFAATELISDPFDLDQEGRVILSAVQGTPNNGNVIAWQRCTGDLVTANSELGNEGDSNVDLRGNIELEEGDQAIVAEVTYNYEPRILGGFFEPQELYTQATFRPRFGLLGNVQPDGASPSAC